MTPDIEKYRADISHLGLDKKDEDILLLDLWQITQTVYDHITDPDFYPLHLAVANEVFDALAEEIAVQSGSKSLMQTVKDHHEKLAQIENTKQKEDV